MDELDGLADAAARRLVEAMAGDTWGLIKRQFEEVTRGRERRVALSRAALAQADGGSRGEVAVGEIAEWRTRLRDALDDDPLFAQELRRILPASAAGGSHALTQSTGSAQSVQQASASGGSNVTQVFAPGSGNVRVNSPEHRHFWLVTPLVTVVRWTRTIVVAHPVLAGGLAVVVASAGVGGAVLGARHAGAAPAGSTAQAQVSFSPVGSSDAAGLAATAQIIRQRADRLRLNDVQVAVAHSNIVVTGPENDETQLKAIAVPGVLQFRQVLLSGTPGPGGSSVAGTISTVQPSVLGLFNDLDCHAPGWQQQAGSRQAAGNTQIVSCAQDGSVKYVLGPPQLSNSDIAGAVAQRSSNVPLKSVPDWEVDVTLTSTGAKRFADLTTYMYHRYGGNVNPLPLDQLGMVFDGVVIASPLITSPVTGGKAHFNYFSRASAQQLAADLQGDALPVALRLSAVVTPASPR